MSACVDPIVGKILAGWRYDISGIAPEMRGDYERHFAACEHCRSRQRMHRMIDISLISLASLSAAVFLLAFGVIRHFEPRTFLLAGTRGIGGVRAFGAPLVGGSSGYTRAHGGGGCGKSRRAPRARPSAAEIRERLPEELRAKLTGS